jgi:hypothetical protein
MRWLAFLLCVGRLDAQEIVKATTARFVADPGNDDGAPTPSRW